MNKLTTLLIIIGLTYISPLSADLADDIEIATKKLPVSFGLARKIERTKEAAQANPAKHQELAAIYVYELGQPSKVKQLGIQVQEPELNKHMSLMLKSHKQLKPAETLSLANELYEKANALGNTRNGAILLWAKSYYTYYLTNHGKKNNDTLVAMLRSDLADDKLKASDAWIRWKKLGKTMGSSYTKPATKEAPNTGGTQVATADEEDNDNQIRQAMTQSIVKTRHSTARKSDPSLRFARANWNKVKAGLSYTEVHSILGNPQVKTKTYWEYGDHIDFFSDKPNEKSGVIYFNASGKVSKVKLPSEGLR